jgi:hypothetical protein
MMCKCKYCGPRKCTCFPDPDETEHELRAELEAEKAAHNLTRDALESCITSENVKSAEIAELRVKLAIKPVAMETSAMLENETLKAEVAALKTEAAGWKHTAILRTTTLGKVTAQRDAAIAALELVKSDVKYIAEALDCFRPADDGGDYCGSVDDCIRCGLLEALAKVGDIEPGAAGRLKTALEGIVTHAASRGGPWAESQAREALAKSSRARGKRDGER